MFKAQVASDWWPRTETGRGVRAGRRMMEWRRLVVRVWKYQSAVLEAVGFAALWVVLTLEALSVWLFGRWAIPRRQRAQSVVEGVIYTAVAAAILIYFRLLGRLAWRMTTKDH